MKKYIHPLRHFISFATNNPNHILRLDLFSENGKYDTTTNQVPNLIKCFFPFYIHQERSSKVLYFQDMLFTLRDIKDEISLYLQNWFNLDQNLNEVVNLYFATQYNPKMYSESKFLSLIQALESYHRKEEKIKKTINNNVLPKECHKRRISSILENTPEKYKKWLKEKLHFSNEPTLKERLNDLVKLTKPTIDPLVAKTEDFVVKVGNTRNYLTHYSSNKKVATGEELFRITQVLSFLLKHCFLFTMGCTHERCQELISKDKEYQYFKENVSNHLF